MQIGTDGLKVTEIINAVYISSSRSKSITLPLCEEVDLREIFVAAKKNKTSHMR